MITDNKDYTTYKKQQTKLGVSKFFFLMLVQIAFTSCKKLIAVDPPITELSTVSVYASNAGAAAVMTGVYDQMESNGNGLTDGTHSISYLEGMASDELTNYYNNLPWAQFYENALSSVSGGSSNSYYWPELYQQIYACNAVLSGLAGSTGVTSAMKQQLNGEAKFMRAFLYFYAVNLYGDVPLITTTNYQANTSVVRTPKADVYQQIIQDLLDAQTSLSKNYVDQVGNSTNEKIRPNYWAATAMLARVYLFTGDWKDAEAQASIVINSGSYSLVSNLNQVFLANSAEAILQFYPLYNYNTSNTRMAYYFVLTSTPGTGSYYTALSPALQNAFETNDARFTNWVGSFIDPSSGKVYLYPFKYQAYQQSAPVTEYLMILRFAEQYLIRAEAEANGAGNGINGAISDLNVIRNRAGLPNTLANDQPSLLSAVLHERQVELFTEWGHRWFDLIRTGNINTVMGAPGNICASKGGTWNANWALVPLPLSELQLDPNLKQNPGY